MCLCACPPLNFPCTKNVGEPRLVPKCGLDGAGRSRRPSEFLSKLERLNLVETLRGLAALSVEGLRSYTSAALSLHG